MSQDTNKESSLSSGRKPLIYHDFNLRFADYKEDGTFKVWVEGETPGGSMKPDDAAQCTYDPTGFWKDPKFGRGGLLGKLDRRNLERDQLFELGRLLAALALPNGKVRTLFQNSLNLLREDEGLRLRLRIDPVALTHLPWEFISLTQVSGEPQDTDFLALQRAVSIVRHDTVESVPRGLPDRDAVRVAGVLSSPEDQDDLQVDQDQKALEEAVQALNQAAGREVIAVKWAARPATRHSVGQVLSDSADIFHFAGHAEFDRFNQEGKIILENEDEQSDSYSSAQLAQLLRDAKVRLVVLGACETGRRDGQNVWNGVAPALTREQIPAVIANQYKIKDDSAILMASKVYHRVLAGFTVDEALYEARQAIYQHMGLKQRDWGTPVLYLRDKDGVLFPPPKITTAGEAPQAPFLQVASTFKQVSGKVVDVKIRQVTGGRIEITHTVDNVEKDGEFTSLNIDSFG